MTEKSNKKDFQSLKPEIASFWSDMEEVLTIDRNRNFYVFIGTFAQGREKPARRIGLCYGGSSPNSIGYPNSNEKITPLMMPYEASLIFLNGLLMDAIQKDKTEVITSIIDTINIIKKEG